jgi:hypothetical protein
VLECPTEGFQVAGIGLAKTGDAGVELGQIILVGDDIQVEAGLPVIGEGMIGFAAEPVPVGVVVGEAGLAEIFGFRGIRETVVEKTGGEHALVGKR